VHNVGVKLYIQYVILFQGKCTALNLEPSSCFSCKIDLLWVIPFSQNRRDTETW